MERVALPPEGDSCSSRPHPPHVLELLAAGNEHQAIADRFVNGFDDPRDFYEWFTAPDQAEQYLAEVGAAS